MGIRKGEKVKHPKLIKAVIISEPGPDTVMLTYEAPSPIWPFEKSELIMKFDAAKGKGVDYVREHFDIEPEVIEVPGW